MRKLWAFLLALTLLLLSACGDDAQTEGSPSDPVAPMDEASLFSDRDKDPSYDSTACAHVTLADDASVSTSNAVHIAGNTVTVTDEGTYLFVGTLSSGTLVVEAEESDKVQIVLVGVSVTAEAGAALYIKASDPLWKRARRPRLCHRLRRMRRPRKAYFPSRAPA